MQPVDNLLDALPPRCRAEGRAERARPSRPLEALRVPGESGRFKAFVSGLSGLVRPMPDAIGLGGRKGRAA